MSESLFRSERLFETWTYTVSHRQLLLRSNKTNALKTRVEILFTDVSFMLITPLFRGLQISLSDPSALEFASVGNKPLYQLETENFTGYVAAGSMSTHEDERGYEEPSTLLIAFHL